MQNLFRKGILRVKSMPSAKAATPIPAVWYMSREIKCDILLVLVV